MQENDNKKMTGDENSHQCKIGINGLAEGAQINEIKCNATIAENSASCTDVLERKK